MDMEGREEEECKNRDTIVRELHQEKQNINLLITLVTFGHRESCLTKNEFDNDSPSRYFTCDV